MRFPPNTRWPARFIVWLAEVHDARYDRAPRQVEQTLTRLTEQSKEPFAQVDRRFDDLEARVRKLQMLEEGHAAQIKIIAEVQMRHGEVLEQHGAALKRIEEALEPLKALPATLQRILADYERRISALEKSSRTRRRTP